jgi:uncharacterized protein YjbI with pentapeptide repeats
MIYRQAWLACGLLIASASVCRADIFRWDNGQLIPGTSGIEAGPEFEFYSGNLRFADLSGKDLTRARLANANLSDATFRNSILTEADLTGTTLRSADLTGAVVAFAGLSWTTSEGLTKEQLYSTASYQTRDLRGIGLSGNDLTGWDLSGQDLTGARLDRGTLQHAKLVGAVVAGADFENGGDSTIEYLTKEQLYSTASYQVKQLPGLSLRKLNLTGWDFNGQNLSGTTFEFAKLTNADFTQADVTAANFGSATAYGFTKEQLYSTASYQAKNLRAVNFGEAVEATYPGPRNDLTGWSFRGQDLTDANLSGATLTNADLSGAIISRAAFGFTTGSGFTKEQLYSTASYQAKDLRGITLYFNNLTGWDFSGQNLTNVSFLDSTLTNARFMGAVLAGAGLDGTTSRGFTKQQLYSTASYQAKDLRGIDLGHNDLTGWDLSGQDLTGAELGGATLTNADLAGAVVAGVDFGFTTSRGFTKEMLYSTASYQSKDLRGIRIAEESNLSGWDLSGQDLTGADFYDATLTGAKLTGANLANANLIHARLTNADLTGAIVKGAIFNSANNSRLTKEQLYSTASYQAKDLQGIGLGAYYSEPIGYFDLTGWDFSGQDLTNAVLERAVLRNTNLSGADTRGAQHLNLAGAVSRNAILPDGKIAGLELAANEWILIRDDDGSPWRQPIPVTIQDQMAMADGSALHLIFEADAWDSLISFESVIPVQIGGALALTFADSVDVATQIGRTLRIFDWTGVAPTGQFEITSPYVWDVTNLYTTGEVTLVAVPEPSAASILSVGILALVARHRAPHFRVGH